MKSADNMQIVPPARDTAEIEGLITKSCASYATDIGLSERQFPEPKATQSLPGKLRRMFPEAEGAAKAG